MNGAATQQSSQSPATKAHAALELLSGRRPLADIAGDAGADPNDVLRWRDELVRNAASLFDDRAGDLPLATLADAQRQANEALVLRLFERQTERDRFQRSATMLQSLLAHQDHTKEEERKRIAREIHDDLGQLLMAIRIDVSMLYERTAAHHPRLHRRTGVVLEHVDTAIGTVRSVISDLRPFELELGLQAAVQWQLNRFERMTGLVCRLTVDAPGGDMAGGAGLGDDLVLAVFRTLQESLNTIARDARASRVEVLLSRSASRVGMTVSDNGVGARAGQGVVSTNLGLVGIRERLSALGGELSVDSAGGQGTRLSMSIPVPV